MPAASPDPADAALRDHAEAARRLARHLVFDRDRADDVAQEAMRVALVRPAADGRPARNWLAGIVRNVARAFVRREGKRRDVEARAAEGRDARRSIDDPAALVARAEEHRRAIDAVLRLAEPYRGTLILRFLEDMEPSEVARRQDVPLETVRTRVRRGLDLVRADLDAGHGGDRRRWMALLAPIPAIDALPAPDGSGPSATSSAGPASSTVVPVLAASGALAVKKIAIGVVVLLLLGVAWRVFLGPDESASRSESAGPSVREPAIEPHDASLAAHARPAAKDALPPPVALDAPGVIDRDRDIHGVVVREDGTPVAGAEIFAVIRPWIHSLEMGDQDGQLAETTLASTRTAVDGTFAMRLERGAAATVRVRAAGLAPFEEENVGAGDRVRIVLQPRVRFVVSVKDATGAPVEGATARLHRMGGSTTWGYVRSRYARVGRTDAAGRVAFDDLPPGDGGTWIILSIEASGFRYAASKRVSVPDSGEATEEIVLRAWRTLRGRVTDAATSKPIAGATLGLGWEQRPRVTTDADGRYAIEAPTAPPSTTVFAEAAGYAWQGVEAGEGATTDFALGPVGTLKGRLLDAAGAPIHGATLIANGTMGATLPTGRASGRSGDDGRFELVRLSRTSPSELWLSAPGFGNRGLALDAIGDSGVKDLGDLVLDAARRVEGRVIDPDGKPVGGVYIELSGGGVEQTRFFTGTERAPARLSEARVTDDLGRFRFVAVVPGDYSLIAQVRGQAQQKKRVSIRRDDALGLEFTLRSGRTLVVHVRAPDGSPAEHAAVDVRLPDGSTHRETGSHEVHFTVPDGDVSLKVVGMRTGQQAPEEQIVPRGTDEVTITLLAADDWTIEGVVVDADGTPIPRAMIDAKVEGSGHRFAADTRADGRFVVHPRGGSRVTLTLTGVQVDPSRAGVHDGAFEAETVEVARGTTDVVIRSRRVAQGQFVRVVVLDPEGRPIAGMPMNLQRPSGGVFVGGGTTDAAGVVEFRDLVGKRVEIHRGSGAYTMGDDWVDPDVDVVPAGQSVEFRFRAGAFLRGVALGPDGAPVAGASVSATSHDRWIARASVATKTDGRFAFPLDPKTQLPLVITVRRGGGESPEVVGRLVLDALPADPVTIRVAPPPLDAK